MTIDTTEIKGFIEDTKEGFNSNMGMFDDGVIQGLNFVAEYIKLAETREGARIAEALNVKV